MKKKKKELFPTKFFFFFRFPQSSESPPDSVTSAAAIIPTYSKPYLTLTGRRPYIQCNSPKKCGSPRLALPRPLESRFVLLKFILAVTYLGRAFRSSSRRSAILQLRILTFFIFYFGMQRLQR